MDKKLYKNKTCQFGAYMKTWEGIYQIPEDQNCPKKPGDLARLRLHLPHLPHWVSLCRPQKALGTQPGRISHLKRLKGATVGHHPQYYPSHVTVLHPPHHTTLQHPRPVETAVYQVPPASPFSPRHPHSHQAPSPPSPLAPQPLAGPLPTPPSHLAPSPHLRQKHSLEAGSSRRSLTVSQSTESSSPSTRALAGLNRSSSRWGEKPGQIS